MSRADDEAAEALVGSIFDGRYQIEQLLGKGGMGAVYRAVHVHLGQRVAIKTLRPHLSGDATAARRMAREAKGTYRLDTEHAVKVFDFGATEAGLVYLVMEYLDGWTVADELSVDGAIEPGRALRMAAQVCEALAAAHRLGFIHRDIKPDNVMILRGGELVKVLDFGLAKLVEEAGAAPFSVLALTQHDMVFGTPEYMAPEQAMGHKLDARADLYAVGATLFEMLTGRPPFVADSPMKLLAAHVKQPPPTLADAKAGPWDPRLEALMARCLAKSPEARPASAEALARELAALAAAGIGAGATRVPRAVATSATVELAAEKPAPKTESAPMTVGTRGMRRSTRTVIGVMAVLVAAAAVVVGIAVTSGRTSRSVDAGLVAAEAKVVVVAPDAAVVAVIAADASVPPDAAAGTQTEIDHDHVHDHAHDRPTEPHDRPAPEPHLAAAEAARREGNRLRQLAEADAALKANPKATRARFLMGEALLETGDVGNGCKYLKQARGIADAKRILASGRCPAH